MRLRYVIVVLVAGALGWVAWRERPALLRISQRAQPHLVPGQDPVAHRARDRQGPGLETAPAGTELDVTLHGPPARWYSAPGEDDANDAAYRDIVAQLAGERRADLDGVEVRYDRALSRAAREVAYQTGALGFTPPEAAMAFLLHSAGAPELSAMQFFTHTTAEDAEVTREAVRRALAEVPDGVGPLRIGVGEVSTPGSTYTRHVSVLATRRAYDIEPTPRLAAPGSQWVLEGRLPGGYRQPKVSVLYPDGRMAEAEVRVTGRRFVVTVPAGDEPGTMYVGMSGVDERGPGKLLQLSVEVGHDLPVSMRAVVPGDDRTFARIEDAEAYAQALLEADRATHGRPALTHDPRLTAIARAHSEDMRDQDFFGHLSPTTGLLERRLARAGYRARTFAENLARNDSVAEAQASLMSSVGHRRNILAPQFTHVGVGLARRDTEERTEWFVTQVFAAPVAEIDPVRARARLLARINTTRSERGAEPVMLDPALSAIAQRHARTVARGAFDGVAQRVVAELAGFDAAMNVSVGAIYELAALELPASALDAAVSAVGIGVTQSAEDIQGRTGVVIISARAPPASDE